VDEAVCGTTFCVDHLLTVEINFVEELLMFDFLFPTSNVGVSTFTFTKCSRD